MRRTSSTSCPISWHRARSRRTGTPRTTSCSSTSTRTTRPTPSRASSNDSIRSTGLTVELGGGPAFYGDVQAVSESDLRRSELVSLPLAGLALLLVFGSVVAAGVPLAVGGTAVVVALAAIFGVANVDADEHLRAQPRDAAGLGLGVDYSLLMTSRFREELPRIGGRTGPRRGTPCAGRSRRPAARCSSRA